MALNNYAGGLGRRPSLTTTTTRGEAAVLYTAPRKGFGDGPQQLRRGPWSQAFLNYNYDQGRGSRPLHGSRGALVVDPPQPQPRPLSLSPSFSSFGHPATMRAHDVPPPALFFSLQSAL